MKSKAQLLVEEINKMLEEKGLPKIKEEKTGTTKITSKNSKLLF